MGTDSDSMSDDEVARIFRDNDNLGDDSSFWIRAARQLFVDQSPLGPMTLLTTGLSSDSQMPLGLLAHTKNNRLVFWPALGKGLKMECDGQVVDMFHHVTVEFPKGRIHLTSYDANGKHIPIGKSLRVVQYPNSPLSVCCILLVKADVLRSQETMFQRKIRVPPGHEKRMNEWFLQYSQSISTAESRLAPSIEGYDYVCYGLYFGPHPLTVEQLPPDFLPLEILRSQVDGCELTPDCQTCLTPFKVGDRTLWIATACPPGTLRKQVVVHFARRRSV